MNEQVQSNSISKQKLENLNHRYRHLEVGERLINLYKDFKPEDIMVTSSFAATSAMLLREVSLAHPDQKVFFINTGNHFPETLSYKRELTELFQLNVISLSASKKDQAIIQEDQTWLKNPDLCCSINKVAPLNEVKPQYRVWVSGLMRWQNEKRAGLRIFEVQDGLLKFHPLLDVTREEHQNYMANHKLPFHPLVSRGYESIGCSHCTRPGKDRNGRWSQHDKTECGLHW